MSDPPIAAELDCSTAKSMRRRSRAKVAADPISKHPDERFKLHVVEYTSEAARKFNVSAGSISGHNAGAQRAQSGHWCPRRGKSKQMAICGKIFDMKPGLKVG